jgi:hypothetical protein
MDDSPASTIQGPSGVDMPITPPRSSSADISSPASVSPYEQKEAQTEEKLAAIPQAVIENVEKDIITRYGKLERKYCGFLHIVIC